MKLNVGASSWVWCLPPLGSSNVVRVKNNLAVAPGHKTFPVEQVLSEVFLIKAMAKLYLEL